jgi:hypothetical protein
VGERCLAAVAGWVVVAGAGGRALGWRVGGADEVLGGVSAAFAVFGWETSRGSLLVGGLAGGVGVGDPEVAGDQDGGGEDRDAGESRDPAPAFVLSAAEFGQRVGVLVPFVVVMALGVAGRLRAFVNA